MAYVKIHNQQSLIIAYELVQVESQSAYQLLPEWGGGQLRTVPELPS